MPRGRIEAVVVANSGTSKVFGQISQSAAEISRAIQSFSANAAAFSPSEEEAVEKYKNKWVAIYEGKIQAVADSLNQLFREIAEKKIPASQTLFRHIDAKDRVLTL